MNVIKPARPRGVFAAVLTPLKDDLSPDIPALLEHCRWLLANGCDGLGILGTTSEANSFSIEERLAMIEAVAASDIPAACLIIGTGCCAIPDTVRLNRAALDIGAAGVLVLPPFYYKNVSEDGLYAAYAETIERTGDNALRLYIYHFPQMTGLDMSLDLFGRLIEAYPENVVGLKNSSGDWSNMEAIIRAFPGFDMFAGTEQYLLPTLKAGGAGCISATTNVFCREAGQVYANWNSAEAEALQERSTALRLAVQAFPPVAACKEIIARATGRASWRNLRPPLANLDREKKQALFAALDDIGYTVPAAA